MNSEKFVNYLSGIAFRDVLFRIAVNAWSVTNIINQNWQRQSSHKKCRSLNVG